MSMIGKLAFATWGISGSAAAQPVLAQSESGRYYGEHMWGGGWWMFLGPIWMIVVIGAIVAVVILLARWLGAEGHASGQSRSRSSVDILKERFARGEIDKEEFQERLKLLD